jgi:hypothetical protein
MASSYLPNPVPEVLLTVADGRKKVKRNEGNKRKKEGEGEECRRDEGY